MFQKNRYDRSCGVLLLDLSMYLFFSENGRGTPVFGCMGCAIFQGLSWADCPGRAGSGRSEMSDGPGRAGPGRDCLKCDGPGRTGPRILKIWWAGPGRGQASKNYYGPGRSAAHHLEIWCADSGRGQPNEQLVSRAGPPAQARAWACLGPMGRAGPWPIIYLTKWWASPGRPGRPGPAPRRPTSTGPWQALQYAMSIKESHVLHITRYEYSYLVPNSGINV